jgi:hypothetical protein
MRTETAQRVGRFFRFVVRLATAVALVATLVSFFAGAPAALTLTFLFAFVGLVGLVFVAALGLVLVGARA